MLKWVFVQFPQVMLTSGLRCGARFVLTQEAYLLIRVVPPLARGGAFPPRHSLALHEEHGHVDAVTAVREAAQVGALHLVTGFRHGAADLGPDVRFAHLP